MSILSTRARQLSLRSTLVNPHADQASTPCSAFALFPRLFLALIALWPVVFTGARTAQAQSLRFVPAIYNVTAVNGVSGAVILNAPAGIATDPQGNLYIADTEHELIRKVSPTQTATIFAGNGAFGYTGDGGQAILASIGRPIALATDPAGNLYFSDAADFAIRKISTTGIITTVAGGHGTGSSGDGGAATSAQISPGGLASDALGNLYVIDTISNTVRMVTTGGNIYTYAGGGTLQGSLADNGPATSAQLISLQALALDAGGNLYIADNGFKHVRKVDTAGIITTFAGNSTSGSSGDGGQAINAQFASVYSLATDSYGNVYIADAFSNNVRMVNSAGIISTVAGNGLRAAGVGDGSPADRSSIGEARSLATDAFGNLFVAVTSTDAIYRVVLHPERFPETKVGATSGIQRLIIEAYGPADVTLSAITLSGDFHIAQSYMSGTGCVLGNPMRASFHDFCEFDIAFSPTAEGIRAFPLTITSNDTPSTLTQTLTSTGLGSALAMTSGQMFTIAGSRAGTFYSTVPTAGVPATSVRLFSTQGLAIDSTGDVFISQGCQVERIDGNTGLLTTYGGLDQNVCNVYFNGASEIVNGDGGAATAAYMPTTGALKLDSLNRLFISDVFDSRIRMIDPSGFIYTYAGAGIGFGNSSSCFYTPDGVAATTALLCFPQGMDFDSSGNLYFAETGNSLIRVVSSTDGKIYTVAGNHTLGAGFSGDGGPATSAQVNQPYGVVVNSAGDIFFSDRYNHVIRKITKATGKISTIAGQHGVQGYSGDGGLAIHSTLNFPAGMAINAAGDVFFADTSNWVIRKIDTAGYITTVAGTQLSEFDNGDGLAATATGLAFPIDIALGASGYLYISDSNHQLVRETSPNGALMFPAQMVGTTSRPKSITLSNIGNMPLHFDAQFPTGITGDFALDSGGNCDFTVALAAGAHCDINITFTPTAAGGRNGVFGFFDDGVASPQYVALSGIGTQPQPQTIHFSAIANKVYGAVDSILAVTSTSGLPVTLTVKSGNATIVGANLHITGAGPVVIAANQAGSVGVWLPATEVTQSFTVTRATLGIIATNISFAMGDPFPAFTYTISPFSSFVNGDTASVLTGAPVFTTTATASSPVGVYNLFLSAGTLAASNYTLILSNGTVTVTPARIPVAPVKITATATVSRIDHYIVTVTVTNSGGATAQNVVLTSVKLNSVAGTPASKAIGSIPVGGSSIFTISVPLSAGAPELGTVEQITGTYTGGTFGGSFRVYLP